MLKLFSNKKRWAVVTDRKHRYKEIYISRNTKNGDSFSIKQPGIGNKWLIVDTQEFMLAMMHVTHTDEELASMANPSTVL